MAPKDRYHDDPDVDLTLAQFLHQQPAAVRLRAINKEKARVAREKRKERLAELESKKEAAALAMAMAPNDPEAASLALAAALEIALDKDPTDDELRVLLAELEAAPPVELEAALGETVPSADLGGESQIDSAEL
jgi:hypothetical protein